MRFRFKYLILCTLLGCVMACTQGFQLPSGQPTSATNIDIEDEEETTELAAEDPLEEPAAEPLVDPFVETGPSIEPEEAVTRSMESRRISAPGETPVTIADSSGTTAAPSSHESVQCLGAFIIAWPHATRPEGIPDSGFNHEAYCRDSALIPASALFSDDFARQAQIRRFSATFVEDDTPVCLIGHNCVRKNHLAEDLGLTAGYYLVYEILDCDALHYRYHERENAIFIEMDRDARFKDARALKEYVCHSSIRFIGDAYVPSMLRFMEREPGAFIRYLFPKE